MTERDEGFMEACVKAAQCIERAAASGWSLQRLAKEWAAFMETVAFKDRKLKEDNPEDHIVPFSVTYVHEEDMQCK